MSWVETHYKNTMELKEFLQIFASQKKVFASVILIGLIGGFAMWYTQPEEYSVSLTVNVARTANLDQGVDEYDSFYRLQADERFGDTIVRWTQSPRFVENVLKATEVETGDFSDKDLRGVFDALRLSSQVIDVQFSAPTQELAESQSQALVSELERQTASLTAQGDQGFWFKILSEDPVIRSFSHSIVHIMGMAFVLSFLVAFVVAVMREYYKKD